MAQTAVGKPGLTRLFPAIVFLVSSLIWIPLESYCHLWFENGEPTYSYKIESLSDLGVNYRQVHELKHYNVTSYAHQWANYNFMQAGVGFAIAQLFLIYITRGRNNITRQTALFRTARTVLSLFVLAGFVLFARVHGGPREKVWKIIGWHWFGFGMIAVAGNLNSFLASAMPDQIGGTFEGSQIYRLLSSMLAGLGLYSYYRFNTMGEWNYATPIGLWQRGSIYPILAWELLTGLCLVVEIFSGSVRSKAKKV